MTLDEPRRVPRRARSEPRLLLHAGHARGDRARSRTACSATTTTSRRWRSCSRTRSAMLDLALDRFAPGDTHVRLPLGHRPRSATCCGATAIRSTPTRRRTRRATRRSRRARARHRALLPRRRPRARRDPQARCPPDTLLVVMSDHGFQPYTRKLHLNAWLRDNGYLALKDGKRTGQIADRRRRLVADARLRPRLQRPVPEPRRAARARASCAPADADGARGASCATKLRRAARSRERRSAWCVRVDRAEDVLQRASARAEAPDLIVGYDRGYARVGRVDARRDHRGRDRGQHRRAGRATT